MEKISKTISLEPYKSRHPSLIPFLDRNGNLVKGSVLDIQGNWGKIPCDINIEKCEGYETLLPFFRDKRVSFREILDKLNILEKLIDKTKFYKKITKNGAIKWVDYVPFNGEKYNIPVYENFNNVSDEHKIIGICLDTAFNDNGGSLMLEFAFKAIGKFFVDKKFIKKDNYVPEILYFCGVEPLMQQLKKMKNTDPCCNSYNYELFGGDEFYDYLTFQKNNLKAEREYWLNALYYTKERPSLYKEGDEYDRVPQTPRITLNVALNTDFRNIGVYTILPNNIEENIVEVGHDVSYTTDSMLKYLRNEKMLYATKDGVDVELPVVLSESKDENFRYELKPKYSINHFKNIKVFFDENNERHYIGDVIYSMTFNDDTDSVEIKYVLDGEIKKNQNNEFYYDEISKTGVRFIETRPCKKYNYKIDTEYSYYELIGEVKMDLLRNDKLVKNLESVYIIYDDDEINAEATFTSRLPKQVIDNPIFMYDYNLGKLENLVENIEDIDIYRGSASAFELHYKIGEINTFEDLMNYGNNIFNIDE